MTGGGCVVRNVTGDAAVASFEVSVRGVGAVVAAGYGRGCVSRLSRGNGGGAPRALSSAHAGSAARSATAAAAASVNPFAAATTLSAPDASSDASGDADDERGTKAARRTRRPSRARRSRGARRVRESREATALDAISRCVVAWRVDRVALSGRKRRTRHRVSRPARQLDTVTENDEALQSLNKAPSTCYASQPRRSTPRPRLARPAGASPLSPQTLNPGRSPRSSARDDPEHRASPPRGCDKNEEKKK